MCCDWSSVYRWSENFRTIGTGWWRTYRFCVYSKVCFSSKLTVLFFQCINFLLLHFRGVLQTLVEKHFPAPDRNRINQLIGLHSKKSNANNNAVNNVEPGSSTGKRKPSKYLIIINLGHCYFFLLFIRGIAFEFSSEIHFLRSAWYKKSGF